MLFCLEIIAGLPIIWQFFLLQESHYKAKQEVQIIIPDKLKYFLADDWGCITRRRRVSNGSIYEELYSCGLDLMW